MCNIATKRPKNPYIKHDRKCVAVIASVFRYVRTEIWVWRNGICAVRLVVLGLGSFPHPVSVSKSRISGLFRLDCETNSVLKSQEMKIR
jgi:hypothetical protein